MSNKKTKEAIDNEITKCLDHTYISQDSDSSCFLIDSSDFYAKVYLVFNKFYDDYRCRITVSLYHKQIDAIRKSSGLTVKAFNRNDCIRYIKTSLIDDINVYFLLTSSGKIDKKEPVKLSETLPVLISFLEKLNNKIKDILDQITLAELHNVINLGKTHEFISYSYDYEDSIIVTYLTDKKNITNYLKIYKNKASKHKQDDFIAEYNKVAMYICKQCEISPEDYFAKKKWYRIFK